MARPVGVAHADRDEEVGERNGADNGVVHVIDALMLPEEEEDLPETVVDIIVDSEVHTLLELAVVAAGLVDALSGEGPFTVYAPTDDAIVALTEALEITADELLALPNLGAILQYHVVAAEAFSDDLSDGQMLTTLEGSDVASFFPSAVWFRTPRNP